VAKRYRRELAKAKGIHLPLPAADAVENFSYFPILVGPKFPLTRDRLQTVLKEKGILSRRYFFPLIPDMEAYSGKAGARGRFPVARRVAEQVLCLPMYGHLAEADQDRVITAVLEAASQ
jgi:dTDP-4-amino-4,6-dideoxygalactose transaminase